MLADKKGLTLIEMLIVTSLIAIVAIAVSSAFLQGNRIFENLREVKTREDIAFFIEKVTRDLRSSINYTASDGTFTERKLSFSAVNERHSKSVGPLGAALVEVTYRYDMNKNAVFREEREYYSHKSAKNNTEELVLDGIDRVKFTASYDPTKMDKLFPRKINLEITCADDNDNKVITKDILLPGAYDETL